MSKKIRSKIETSLNEAKTAIFFDVSEVTSREDGSDAVTVVGRATLNLPQVSEANKAKAQLHGWIQRIADAAAKSNDKSGQPAAAAVKLASMQALIEHYHSGSEEWSIKRAGGGIGADESLLAQALSELYPQTAAEKIRARVAGMTRVERTAMLNSSKLEAIVSRLRAGLTKDVDVDGLFAELEAPTATMMR